jgi:hypothetical protein
MKASGDLPRNPNNLFSSSLGNNSGSSGVVPAGYAETPSTRY